MGCSQSKIENEEAVARCKERKELMKSAVSARNAFAAAHSAYAISLKNTGAALSDYAQGESYHPSSLPYATPSSSSQPVITAGQPNSVTTGFETLRPPPPLPDFRLQRAASMPEMVVPKAEVKVKPVTILEEGEEEDGIENDEDGGLRQRSRRRRGGGSGGGGNEEVASRAPLPRQQERVTAPVVESRGGGGMVGSNPPQEYYDFFFHSMENVPGPVLGDDVVRQNESATSSVTERDEVVLMDKAKEGESESEVAVEEKVSSVSKGDDDATAVMENVVEVKGGGKKGKVETGGKRVMRGAGSVNLMQVFVDLDDYFLKASESAHEVSKMLEATRLHYHSNFADNRGKD